jgi:hypothetical protein
MLPEELPIPARFHVAGEAIFQIVEDKVRPSTDFRIMPEASSAKRPANSRFSLWLVDCIMCLCSKLVVSRYEQILWTGRSRTHVGVVSRREYGLPSRRPFQEAVTGHS